MKNIIKNKLSSLNKNTRNKIADLRSRSQEFTKKFEKVKNQPRSKRKSLFFGFTTVISVFGITFLIPLLPAVAKDVPKNIPKPGQTCPISPANQAPPRITPSEEIIKGIAGAASFVCGVAVSSGSFVIGAACGLVVVIGILKSQGK